MKIIGATPKEQEMVDGLTALDKIRPDAVEHKRLEMKVFEVGNSTGPKPFTVVVLTSLRKSAKQFVGVCKFNPNDGVRSPNTGRWKALYRAVTGEGYGTKQHPA